MKIRAFEERVVMQKVVSCDLEISPGRPTRNFKEARKNCNGFLLLRRKSSVRRGARIKGRRDA